MTDTLNIAIAQLNPTVGDVQGNLKMARRARTEAAVLGADLVVFPELFLIGYPPEDLVLKPALQDAAMVAAEQLALETADGGPAMLITTCWLDEGKLYNSVLLADDGEIQAVRHKADLPNYGVFDEIRVFEPGPMPGPINFRGVRLGVPICEDIWSPDVVECLQETGAEMLIVPNSSPFESRKVDQRLNHVVARVTESGLPLMYVNQVGGQDELVFDGGSFVLNADRKVAARVPEFEQSVQLTRWQRGDEGWSCVEGTDAPVLDQDEATYRAMTLGLRDYVNKNGFPGVVLGMSGGIDSALSAIVAVDALGPERVWCVMLPSVYTSQESLDDAADACKALGARLDTVSIADSIQSAEGALAHIFQGQDPDITEENMQARMRGLLLMAISNKFGHMVLTTGNKSEMSVGYATIYGDMCGGYSVLKDLYKMAVYRLSDWRNKNVPGDAMGPGGEVVPQNIIDKAPTAELRPDQTDQDSLPPYPALDDILEGLVENEQTVSEIVSRGHDREIVKRIEHLLYIAEYKRRQAPPGVKLGTRNFGRDRRYPITNRFRDNDLAGAE